MIARPSPWRKDRGFLQSCNDAALYALQRQAEACR